MNVAIMQPYFIPYIGYFQLIKAADKFVIYDDVNYINRGWINRNNILINAKSTLVVVPLLKASQNKLINEIQINLENKEKEKLLKSLEFAYKKAPYFNEVFPLFDLHIRQSSNQLISTFNFELIKQICNYLNISTSIKLSSETYNNKNLSGQQRIIDICIKEAATKYINLSGGVNLYTKELFNKESIDLSFIKSKPVEYRQFSSTFVPFLSIIDVIMFNSRNKVNDFLNSYDFI